MTEFRRRALYIFAYVLALTAAGTIGFLQLPGWNLPDALWMTITTITAVGYEEVRPLDGGGRALATLLLAGGITGMGLWFALLTSAIVEMDLAHVFRKRRTMREIRKLTDHIIVCGGGRTGRQVVRELVAAGVPWVMIERGPERAERIRDEWSGAPVLERDATRDEALVEAGVGRARGLVAALSEDTDNVFVCLSARDLQPTLTIVARAHDEETVTKLVKAGADHVVSPNVTGGIRMASVLVRPEVMSFLDVVTRGEGLALRLEQVTVPNGSPLAGRTLADCRIPQKTGLIVIAVRRADERGETALAYNPGPQERIDTGDVLIVLGASDQVDALRRVVSP